MEVSTLQSGVLNVTRWPLYLRGMQMIQNSGRTRGTDTLSHLTLRLFASIVVAVMVPAWLAPGIVAAESTPIVPCDFGAEEATHLQSHGGATAEAPVPSCSLAQRGTVSWPRLRSMRHLLSNWSPSPTGASRSRSCLGDWCSRKRCATFSMARSGKRRTQVKVAITLRRDEHLSIDIHLPRQSSTVSPVA